MTTKKRATKGAINKIKQPNIKQKRKRAKKILLVLTGLLIISLGMTIYFGLNEVQQGGQSLSLEIISTAEVVSGQEIVYQIAYENKDEVVLSKINLTLTYPQGFYFKSASLSLLMRVKAIGNYRT